MKKHIFTYLLFIVTITISAQEINWIPLKEAIELQKTAPKKIMIDVYTNWCGPCIMLDRNTFHNKDLVNYVNKNYYAVKFNAEGNDTINFKEQIFTNPNYDPKKTNKRNSPHQFSNYMGITAFPTIAFIDENSDFIIALKGYKTPQQLEFYLKLFKDNKHTEMTTQEEFNAYFEAFVSQFK